MRQKLILVLLFCLSHADSISQSWEVESVFSSLNIPLTLKPRIIYWGRTDISQKINALPGNSLVRTIDLSQYDTVNVQDKLQSAIFHVGFKLVKYEMKPLGFIDDQRWEFSASIMPLSENRTRFVAKFYEFNKDTVLENYETRIREYQSYFTSFTSYSKYLGRGKRIRPYLGITAQISVPIGKVRTVEDKYKVRAYSNPNDSSQYISDSFLTFSEYYQPREAGFVLGVSPFISLESSVSRYFEVFLRSNYNLYVTRHQNYSSYLQHYRNFGLQLGVRIRLKPQISRIYRI